MVTDPLSAALRKDGFAFVRGEQMRALLLRHGPLDDWASFAASWSDLGPDDYLAAATGRQRKRRHAVFETKGDAMERQPDQPHFQSRDHNPLQGGIERWFEPVTRHVAESDCLRTILLFGLSLFGSTAPAPRWRIEVHQFRIEATSDGEGEPTPEGSHRDGVDHVLVLLVDRTNIERGTTSITRPNGEPLGEFTLTQPLDTALLDDDRVYHGVTAVAARDPEMPAHRDVLVVTWRRA